MPFKPSRLALHFEIVTTDLSLWLNRFSSAPTTVLSVRIPWYSHPGHWTATKSADLYIDEWTGKGWVFNLAELTECWLSSWHRLGSSDLNCFLSVTTELWDKVVDIPHWFRLFLLSAVIVITDEQIWHSLNVKIRHNYAFSVQCQRLNLCWNQQLHAMWPNDPPKRPT
jgi:hypothetical protein